MKQATYTLACNKEDVGNQEVSKMEKQFEQYMEGVVERLKKSGKSSIDKWFVHVRIED